ncbi:MAG TPA: septal ring lytic transglycosylase RlpA family protein [Candidatus Limnocylindria bacterium]|nr:septal ring lytic transglycosylase RlpA family protein [Candidatus Limnocylindria bacterium]
MQPFPARQVVDGKMRSLYGRRFCLSCSAYGTRDVTDRLVPRVAARPRAVAGRDEWFFRSVNGVLGLLSPRRAPVLARTGVAVFGFSLLLPMFVSGVLARPSAQVIVAASADLRSATVYDLPRLPEPVARSRVLAATPEAAPSPAARPTPTRVAAVPIEITAVPAAATGSVVTASWYGPGFYENRLPCWQWLAANGLPIQFLPDTWGVAHKSLPCGTQVTLTHGTNTVTVPVVDRGPYIAGREFDLSPSVKAALGCTDLCTVVMQIR